MTKEKRIRAVFLGWFQIDWTIRITFKNYIPITLAICMTR